MMTQPAPSAADGERRVTRVAFQQHDPSRVNVFVDGRFALAISAVEAVHRGLKPGRLLTAADLDDLRHLEERERARNGALALLAVRPRSRRELTDRLVRKGLPAEVVTGVLDDLAARGYVDDAAFARYWVENRQANRPRGRRALTAELRAKGVDAGDIDAATLPTAADEEASALVLARRRAATLREPDPRRFQQRLGAFLQRKGYAYDTVRVVVAAVLAERGAAADDGNDDPA
jgi:regulatory protein